MVIKIKDLSLYLSTFSLLISCITPFYLWIKSRVNLLIKNIGTYRITPKDFYILISITNKSSKQVAITNINIFQKDKLFESYRKSHAFEGPLWDISPYRPPFKQVPEIMTTKLPYNLPPNETKDFLIEFVDPKGFDYFENFELEIKTPNKIIHKKCHINT